MFEDDSKCIMLCSSIPLEVISQVRYTCIHKSGHHILLQIMRRDEEMAPFVAGVKRNYIFGGICSIAANASMTVGVHFISLQSWI